MNEEIKQSECPHCHGKFKNLGSHLRHCKENPEKPADTANDKKSEIPEPAASPKTIITDVQPSMIDPEMDDVAWFINEDGHRIFKVPSFIGLMTTNSGTIPCYLVPTLDGMLIPPAMIAGFLGMFSKYHDFPAAVEHEPKKEEIQPEEPTKPIEQPKIQEEKPERIIVPPTIHAQEQKKKSLFAGIFGKKEAKEKPKIQKDDNADLARQIIEAQNGV